MNLIFDSVKFIHSQSTIYPSINTLNGNIFYYSVQIVSGHYEKDVDDPRFKHRSEGKKDGKEEAASEAAAKEPQQQPAHAFAVEFATHLDAQEFMFHAPTIAGLGIKVEALWSDLTRSRFSLESALDYGCMQRLESFFYRHRADAPRTAKTRKMEPKQIYVHGDYKKVGSTCF